MPLNYPGIEIPKGGLTFHLEGPRKDHGEAAGWLRLMVRATRAPLLMFSVFATREAYPERVSAFSLSYRGPLPDGVDQQFENVDLSFPCARADKHGCWSQ